MKIIYPLLAPQIRCSQSGLVGQIQMNFILQQGWMEEFLKLLMILELELEKITFCATFTKLEATKVPKLLKHLL